MPTHVPPFDPKRILCPTDFTAASRAALQTAVNLARPVAGTVRIMHVVPIPVPVGGGMAYLTPPAGLGAEARAALIDDLRRFAEPAAAAGLETLLLLREGDAPHEILDDLERSPADLVVMGRGRRGALERLVLGSVTERVTRRSPVPVLVVDEPVRALGRRRVLCAVELDAASTGTLACAHALTTALGGELTVLHVVREPEDEPWARTGFEIAEYGRLRLRDEEELLSDLAGRVDTGIERRIVRGSPRQRIAEIAREISADVVVVGCHGRGVFGVPALGSTVRTLLHECAGAVLVVPSLVATAAGEPGSVAAARRNA